MYPALLKCFYLLFSYLPLIIYGDNGFGRCGNPTCSVPVGHGVTLIKYTSSDGYRIAFSPNEEVEIFVKDYGPKKDLWGVMLNGHKGYISKNFIREVASYTKTLVPAAIEFMSENVISSSHVMISQVQVFSHEHQPDPHLNSEVNFDYSQSLKAEVNSHFLSSNYEPESLNSRAGPAIVYSQSSTHSSVDGSAQAQLESSVQMLDVPNPSSHSSFMSQGVLPSPSSIPAMSRSENVLFSSDMPNIGENVSPYQQVVIPQSSNIPRFVDSITMQNNIEKPPQVFYGSDVDSGRIYPSNNLLSESFSHQTPLSKSMDHIPTQVSHHAESRSHQSDILPQSDASQLGQFSESSTSSELFPQHDVSLTQSHPENINSVNDADFSKTLSMLKDRGVDESEYIHTHQPNINPDGFQSSQKWHAKQTENFQPESLLSSQLEFAKFKTEPSPLYGLANNLQHNNPNMENKIEFSSVSNDEQKVNPTPVPESLSNTVEDQNEENINDEITYNDDVDDDEEDDDVEEEDEENTADENNELESLENIKSFERMSTLKSESMHTQNYESMNTQNYVSLNAQNSESTSTHNSGSMSTQNAYPSAALFGHHSANSEQSESAISEAAIVPSKVVSEESAAVTRGSIVTSSLPNHEQVLQNVNSQQHYESIFEHKEIKNLSHETDLVLDANAGPSDNVVTKNDHEIQDKSNLLNETVEYVDAKNESDSKSTDQNSDLDKLLNRDYVNETENEGIWDSYQIRNLKGEHLKGDQNVDPEAGSEENITQENYSPYNTFENGLEALRSFLEILMSWIPEPFYSSIMDLDRKGIPPRVPVFTALSAVPCIFLIITLVYIKEHSKENKLIAQLIIAEKNVHTLTAEKNVLEEKLENVESEVMSLKALVDEDKISAHELTKELKNLQHSLEVAKSEVKKNMEEIDSLKQKEKEYLSILDKNEKQGTELLEQKTVLENELKDKESIINDLTHQLQETRNELDDVQKEKLLYIQSKDDYEEKLTQLQQNCNQLLQEAEVWNARVTELNVKLDKEVSLKDELANDLKEKNDEIESLKLLVETFKAFDEIEISGKEIESREEKLQFLKNSSSVLAKLQRQEEENRLLSEKLNLERNKILDMEVEILDSRSEIDKLKLSYNQALQDKAEAQTKLEVLTNYFKDKELQLQKQLGAQEAVRQKKEEDVSSAERRICLIEQENSSYKYQVASMKQEMEETERNLKSQIASQEKKAHENWIAARAAERKLEDMKQEVTQLRQRLTLLEREQENWANLPRDEVIRPVPKRMPGINDDSNCSQEINASLDIRHGMFPPQLHERMPPPLMLPPDRPLPPLPPPPMPPFLPPLDPHFRPQPWHLPPDSVQSSDFRTTPPEFLRGRESTPPRGRQSAVVDGDMGPHASSPLGADTRDSRNSTPPHSLPDFHDIPPQPPRPFFPPPGHHSRFSLPPPFRRDIVQGSKRTDNQGEFNSSTRGTQQSSVPQERWQHSNTRV